MILKKPYALFIKLFKPLHLLFSILLGYLIFLENNILTFLNNYIYSSNYAANVETIKNLTSNLLYIFPFVLIVFSLLMLGIMYKKKKPFLFYIITIFTFIVVIIINFYGFNFLKLLPTTTVSIKSVKLIHDLIFINIGIETVTLIFYIIRGTGVNFKKFNFSSDISKMNISESDKEEIEINIEVDINENRRKRKYNIRNFKYFFEENKFLIITAFIFIIIIIMGIIFSITLTSKKNKEGNIYNIDLFNIRVNSTLLLNTDYSGEKITDDYLIVINADLNSGFHNKELDLSNFKLNIENISFRPTIKYNENLYDIGEAYNGQVLTGDLTNYLFVFEIPEKYITSDMIFSYKSIDSSLDILLNPNKLIIKDGSEVYSLGDTISFDKTLGNINFNIREYQIGERFDIEYNYCVKKDDCVISKEYLVPTINQNFDKAIIKLNLEYTNDSKINSSNFYDFFSKFGSIYYKLNDKWYVQRLGFERIKSSKIVENNIEYIGINSDILNASEIYLKFNIRGYEYKYTLKGEI